jgi:hypothetical protein
MVHNDTSLNTFHSFMNWNNSMTSSVETFDEVQWKSVCDVAANEAGKRCAQSHDLYVKYLSEEIEAKISLLPADHHNQAVELAKYWDYATPQERNNTQVWNAQNGYCSHGIELGCCPAGCE